MVKYYSFIVNSVDSDRDGLVEDPQGDFVSREDFERCEKMRSDCADWIAELLCEKNKLDYEIGCLKSKLNGKEIKIKELEKKHEELKEICNRTDDEKEKEIDRLRLQLFIKETTNK